MSRNASPRALNRLFQQQMNYALCAVFLCWSLFGLLPIAGRTNAIPFTVMDVIFITTTVFVFLLRPFAKGTSYLFAAAILLYLSIDLLLIDISISGKGYSFDLGIFKDYLYSDKYLIYLVLICVFSCSSSIEAFTVGFLLKMMLAFCLVKYGYSHIIGLDNHRPMLLLENNYEQMMVMILFTMYSAICRWEGRVVPQKLTALMVIVVALSGSRSAIVALVPLVFFLYAKPTPKNLAIFFVLIPVLAAFIVFTFESRTSASGQIDRIKFLDVFLYEVRGFNLLDYFFGLKPLSPLSPESCSRLAYYHSMFSSQGNGTCYATVLHSYILRSLHDHGVFGCITPFFIIYIVLGNKAFSMREKLSMVSIAFLCGFSVSGIGANFVAFPLALACGLRRPNEAARPAAIRIW